jgi:predicted Rossmann-fold nucleotide-binding protein
VKEFRVLVCGGRDYDNRERLFRVLDQALQAVTMAGKSFTLIHGGCRGADSLAHVWATERKITLEGGNVRVYHANWERDKKAAGPIRNKLMLTENPHAVIAFPGGKGTANMVNISKKAGIPIYFVKD